MSETISKLNQNYIPGEQKEFEVSFIKA